MARRSQVLTVVFAPAQTLSEVSPFQRDRVAAQLMQPGYVRKLLQLFSVRRHVPGCNRRKLVTLMFRYWPNLDAMSSFCRSGRALLLRCCGTAATLLSV